MRLTKIERVFGAFSGRTFGGGGGDFVRIEIFYCSIDLYGPWELILSIFQFFEPRKGQIFQKILARVV